MTEFPVSSSTTADETVIRSMLREPNDYLLRSLPSGNMELWHRSITFGDITSRPIRCDPDGALWMTHAGEAHRFAGEAALRGMLADTMGLYDVRRNVVLYAWAEAAGLPEVRRARWQLVRDMRAMHAGDQASLELRIDAVQEPPPLWPARMQRLHLIGLRAAAPVTLPGDLSWLLMTDCATLPLLADLPRGLSQLVIVRAPSLSVLGSLPDRLQYLLLADAPALTTLPALPTSLTSLDLSGCVSLARLPELPAHLTRLVLRDSSALTELPVLPPGLQVLDLSGCRSLTMLPAVRPPSLRELDLTGCVALPARLPEWTRTLTIIRRNLPILPGDDPVEYWLRQSGQSVNESVRIQLEWARVREQPGALQFETMLRRLGDPFVRRLEVPDPVHVTEVIEEVLLAPRVREQIFAAASDADCDCHDRPLLRFNDIQTLAKGNRLLRNGAGEHALLHLARSAYRQNLLDETVNAVMLKQWREPFDPGLPVAGVNRRRQSNATGDGPNVAEALEVQLALRQSLGTTLDLPFATKGLHTQMASLNVDDLKFALRQVTERFADLGAMADGVLAQPMWRRYLEARHEVTLARVSERFEREGAELEARQAALPAAQRLPDQAYKEAYDEIARRRESALNAVLREQTEAALHYPAWAERLRTFSADYVPLIERLEQRVQAYLGGRPDAARVTGLRALAAQCRIVADTLRGAAALPLAEQVRLARLWVYPNTGLPSEAALSSVRGATDDSEYFSILKDLIAIEQRRLLPPSDPWFQPSTLLQRLTQNHAPDAPPQARLLHWPAVRERTALAFAEAGRRTGGRVHHAPQSIWLGAADEAAQRGRCTGLALAWAFDPGATTLFDNVFAAAAHPDAHAVRDFAADVDALHRLGPGAAGARLADVSGWDQAIARLERLQGARALLVHVGNHSVALAAQGEGSGVRYAFYDPNAGAWLDIPDAAQLRLALEAHFSPELRAFYAFDGAIQAYAIRPPAEGSPLQAARLGANTALRTGERWAGVRPVAGRRIHSALAPVGSGLRLYGAYRALSSVRTNFQNNNEKDAAIDLAALVAEGVGEGMERGGVRLADFMSRSLKNAVSGAASVGRGAGRLLARCAGILGNLVTLPFDLYSAITGFQAAEQTRGLDRQDALFQGSMATLGAAIGLGVAVTVATSASAGVAAVAGPAGVAIGVAMVAISQLYAAVRQVQEVGQWVALSSAERIRLGWRCFIGVGIDSATERQVLEARYARQVQEQFETEARRLLEAPSPNVGAVLYPHQNVRFRWLRDAAANAHAHQHVVARGESDILASGGGRSEMIDAGRFARVIMIRSGDARATYEIFIEPGDDDIEVASGSLIVPGTTLMTLPQGETLPLMIFAGNGNDRVVGARLRANRIELGSGDKAVTGGDLDDVISLDPHPAWNELPGNARICRQSHALSRYRYHLDGGAGSDTLQLATRLGQTGLKGYRIDLAARTIAVVGDDGGVTLLGDVSNIENLYHLAGEGDEESAYQLSGDDAANILAGTGRDVLEGRGGNDVLQVSGSASAEGGEGDDVYLVGVLKTGDHIRLRDSGQGGVGQAVRLAMGVESIRDWRVIGNDLEIRLHNEARLTIRDVYENSSGQRLPRPDGWVFITRDGLMLQPELPAAFTAEQPAAITVAARYVKEADADDDGTGAIVLDMAARVLALGVRRIALAAYYRLSGEGLGAAGVLRGTAGDDLLRGGAQPCTLVGNGGNDVFVIEAGVGEVVVETGADSAAQNALVLPVTLDGLQMRVDGEDVVLTLASSGAGQTVRHRRGAMGGAPLFVVDTRDEQLHWAVDPERREVTQVMRIDRLIERMAVFAEGPGGVPDGMQAPPARPLAVLAA